MSADQMFGHPDSPVQHMVTRHGVRVELLNTRPDIRSDLVLERLDEALDLIAAHQPWRLRHLVRDIEAIRIERFACRGAFIPDQRVIITELTFLARRDISAAPVASSILHEGVHARVNAMGVRRAGRDAAKEERVCRRAELSFGLALPEALGAPVVERAMASLQLADQDVAPTVDWSLAVSRTDAIDRAARRAE